MLPKGHGIYKHVLLKYQQTSEQTLYDSRLVFASKILMALHFEESTLGSLEFKA